LEVCPPSKENKVVDNGSKPVVIKEYYLNSILRKPSNKKVVKKTSVGMMP
jgi:hypothetical protein